MNNAQDLSGICTGGCVDSTHIVLTGSDGFIGSRMATRLKLEHVSFAAFDKKKQSLFEPSTLENLLHGVSMVLHFAGANRTSEYELFQTNTIGTLGVLEAMKRYCPNARILFASTSQVYSENVYGTSKRIAEEIIEWYTKTTSIKGTILRFSNIYGPGSRPFYNSVIATFFHLIKNNQEIDIHGDGKQLRDYIYIDDVINAVWKAIVHTPKKPFEIFDICSGKKTSVNSVIGMIKNIYTGPVNVRYDSTIPKEEKEIKQTNVRARTILGWQPNITMKKGLKIMLDKLR